jgi:predicted nucleotide-binding protein
LEGIDAHIVTAATSQLTPFAYGNVRLFVAKSHEKEARALLKDFNARQQVFEDPIFSSTQILLIIVAGIVAMSLVLYFLRAIFTVVFP